MKKIRVAVFIALVQIILFLGHYLVFKIFIEVFSITSIKTAYSLSWVFFILAFIFPVVSVIIFHFRGRLGRIFYRLAAVWLGTFYWLFLATIATSLLYLLTPEIAGSVGQILMPGALLISLYGVINSHITRITRLSLKLPNLPKSWQGKTAVLVADTHMGSYWNVGFSKKIARMVSSLNPYIVFFSGDFYDGPPADFEALAKPFANIKSTEGIYFCAGNHEEFGDPSPFFAALRTAGINVLNNEIKIIDGVQIIGIGFHAGQNPQRQVDLFNKIGLNKNLPGILLKHEPSHIEVAEKFNISLQLSGHTHLGQMWPLNYITKKVYGKFHTGLNNLGETSVYTTTGAGTWGPPLRVGNNPEIVEITFQ